VITPTGAFLLLNFLSILVQIKKMKKAIKQTVLIFVLCLLFLKGFSQSIDGKENFKYCEGNSKYIVKCLMDKKINEAAALFDVTQFKSEAALKEQLVVISNDLQKIMFSTYILVGSSMAEQKTHVKCGFYSTAKDNECQYKVETTFSNLKAVSISRKNKQELIKENAENKKSSNDIPPPPPR
jgi:hypothetical protein